MRAKEAARQDGRFESSEPSPFEAGSSFASPDHVSDAQDGVANAGVQTEILHVVGRVTQEVFSFLGPATSAMADLNVHQTVMLLDDPATRATYNKLPPGVDIVLVPFSGSLGVDQWRICLALHERLRQAEVAGIHLHGVLPCLAGGLAIRLSGLARQSAVCFSPHGSRLLETFRGMGRLLVALAGWMVGRSGSRAIASAPLDAERWKAISDFPVDVIESPVSARFLGSIRSESAVPLILAGGGVTRADDALNMFMQIAVLLGDYVQPSRFVWLGAVDSEQLASLKAAGVESFDAEDDAKRCAWLSQAWIYIAPAGGRGVPIGLVEAMASSVPCVAAATALHRDLVVDKKTGFLFSRIDEALVQVAELLDSAQRREQVGLAARSVAHRRFRDLAFRERLVRSYRDANLLILSEQPRPDELDPPAGQTTPLASMPRVHPVPPGRIGRVADKPGPRY